MTTDSGIVTAIEGVAVEGPKNHRQITQPCKTTNCTKHTDGAIVLRIFIARACGSIFLHMVSEPVKMEKKRKKDAPITILCFEVKQ
jgi:hypothetical protein